MQVKAKIENWAKETLGRSEGFSLVHPKDLKNGDFTLIINGDGAKADFDKLEQNKLAEISKIEFVAPRFINIYLSESFFAESLNEINQKGEEFGNIEIGKGDKIMVEYTDPNPFKEFHIGHLMSNTIGESIARVIGAGGAEVKRANWQGDVGVHVATAVWGINDLKLDINSASPKDLGKAYAHGATLSKENENIKKEIIEINKHIFARDDEGINKTYDTGRRISLEYFETIYKRLGTKFDYYFFEGKEGLKGKPIVEAHLEDGIFEKSDGAVIFRGENYGLHTRVFINSNGLPTYEAKELGLNKEKFEVEPSLTKSIIITGNEIQEYFKVLLKVISLIFPDIAEKTKHLPHGMLRLPTGKMSSRTGDVITAESLISKVKELVMEKIADRDFSPEEKEQVAEIVAIGAIKYSILRQAIGGDIIFDFDKSISFEGDSGPYLQYTCVRAKSVLERANLTPGPSPINMRGENYTTPKKPRVTLDTPSEVERLIYRFPEIVEKAGQEYAPHYLVTYLVELAAAFNSFYAQNKIIDEDSPAVTAYRLALTGAVSVVLTNGLHLLGIKVPERM